MYGGQLTAAVLPPLSQLQQPPAPSAGNGVVSPSHTVTREQLGCELAAVNALRTYVDVSKGE